MARTEQIKKQPKKRGAPQKVSLKKLLEMVPGTGGVLAKMAQKAGITRGTLWIYCNKYPELESAINDEKEIILDACEFGLISKIQEKDLEAIKYYLAKKGQSRGYSDSLDIKAQLSLNKGLEINIIKPDDPGDEEKIVGALNGCKHT